MKAYVIILGWGEYSDRGTKPVRVYLDKIVAQESMARLETIESKYRKIIRPYHYKDGEREEVQKAKEEYAAIGFEADAYNDWELVEADLDTSGERGC